MTQMTAEMEDLCSKGHNMALLGKDKTGNAWECSECRRDRVRRNRPRFYEETMSDPIRKMKQQTRHRINDRIRRLNGDHSSR